MLAGDECRSGEIKIGLCAAFSRGCEIAQFMLSQPPSVSFVATCDVDGTEYEEKIAALCDRENVKCFRRVNVNDPDFISKLKCLGIDIVILGWWPGIVKKAAIHTANFGWINLHPSLLPYGRGKHGYYWAVVEKSPFGVTLHLVDEGIDDGPILFQREFPVAFTDTGESLYEKGAEAVIELFKEKYDDIVQGRMVPQEQDHDQATFHWGKEIETHSLIDLGREYKAGDLIDILRARTFLRGESAYCVRDGKRYRLKLIVEEDQSS